MTEEKLNHPEPTDYSAFVAKPMVELADLHKKLGGKEVLRGVSLSIRQGESLAILGLSGTGKSVTLKHIIGLMKPDTGVVRIDGQDVTNGDPRRIEEVRERIGYLFQNSALLASLTVYENIALPLREHEELSEEDVRARVAHALKLVGLEDVDPDQMPAHLSGGMRKRVGLARALIRQPEILLYDEPTAGLDPPVAMKIGDLIREMQKKLGVTSIIVTHNLPFAFQVADRVAMLDEGRIVEQGTPGEFRISKHPLVRQFIESAPGGARDKEEGK